MLCHPHSLTHTHTHTHTHTEHITLPPGSAAPLPPTTLTFTCHRGFIFTATTAHLPTLSPDCQSAAGRLPLCQSINRPKALSRHKHRHQQQVIWRLMAQCHFVPNWYEFKVWVFISSLNIVIVFIFTHCIPALDKCLKTCRVFFLFCFFCIFFLIVREGHVKIEPHTLNSSLLSDQLYLVGCCGSPLYAITSY